MVVASHAGQVFSAMTGQFDDMNNAFSMFFVYWAKKTYCTPFLLECGCALLSYFQWSS